MALCGDRRHLQVEAQAMCVVDASANVADAASSCSRMGRARAWWPSPPGVGRAGGGARRARTRARILATNQPMARLARSGSGSTVIDRQDGSLRVLMLLQGLYLTGHWTIELRA